MTNRLPMRLITPILVALLSVAISGCSYIPFIGDKDDDDKPDTENYTETDFYNVIQRNLNGRQWDMAIKNLQALEAQFPFGAYAEQAQLELIYAYHLSADYEAAIAAADRFIRLHPRHPNTDYAYYLKGLSTLRQSRSLLDGFLPTDQTTRDPGAAREAFVIFSEMLTRYPNSTYAADARKRMIHLRNLLARYEVNAANYYFKRGAYVAAANRGRFVVENFQQTPSVPDGLAIMAEAYHLLGMDQLSTDTVKILAANYPEYPSLDAEGNFDYQGLTLSEKGWLQTVSFGLYNNVKPPFYDSREIYNPQYKRDIEPEKSEGHSWLHWLTFGLMD